MEEGVIRRQMVKEVDVRGLSCPQPVIMVKKAIDTGKNEIVVLANDSAAIGNIQRLAVNNGSIVELETKPDGDTLLRIRKK